MKKEYKFLGGKLTIETRKPKKWEIVALVITVIAVIVWIVK